MKVYGQRFGLYISMKSNGASTFRQIRTSVRAMFPNALTSQGRKDALPPAARLSPSPFQRDNSYARSKYLNVSYLVMNHAQRVPLNRAEWPVLL